MKQIVGLLAIALGAAAAERTFELRGKLEPAPDQWLQATLSGAYEPFHAQERVNPRGEFRFKRLAAGTYTLVISGAQGQQWVVGNDLPVLKPTVHFTGVIRQTVEVGPTVADKKGRVNVTVAFRPEEVPGAAERRHTVGLQDLAIPDEAKREYLKAFDVLGKRDHQGAEKHLRRAIELAPAYSEAWNLLGTVYYQTQRFEEAERHFREALKHHPDAFAPLVNLGGVLLNLRRCQEALEYNRRAVTDRPKDALANSQMGTSYYCLQQDDRAIPYFQTAKRLDPRHFSNPQLLLADIFERRGELQRAAGEIEDYIRLRPDVPNAAALRDYARKLRSGVSGAGPK